MHPLPQEPLFPSSSPPSPATVPEPPSLVPPKTTKGRGFRLRICLEAMKKLGDWFWGWFFLTMGSISLVGFLYAAILSKLLPPSDNAIISSIQNDWYYIFLVPLTLPILMIAVYFHWLCMKLFKHA